MTVDGAVGAGSFDWDDEGEVEGLAKPRLSNTMTGEEDSIASAIVNVKPSLILEWIDDGSSCFNCYRQRLTDPTYLQLETLLSQISLRFHLEHLMCFLISTFLTSVKTGSINLEHLVFTLENTILK